MPQKLDDLTRKTGADTVLLARLLRSLGSIGAVGEVGDVGQEAYVSTKVTKNFVIPTLAAGVECCFDILGPNWKQPLAYLMRTNHRNPTDPMNAAFHEAHNTTDHFMPFLATNPDFQKSFRTYMSAFGEGRTKWTDYFAVEREICKGIRQGQEALMFVDVGGMGIALKKRYPHLPGRFVNQDLPQVVSDQRLDGVESMAHDFLCI